MNIQITRTKETYNSPQLERYGNVRDLTQTVTGSFTGKSDNGHTSPRTH